jgi:hypothetical protein
METLTSEDIYSAEDRAAHEKQMKNDILRHFTVGRVVQVKENGLLGHVKRFKQNDAGETCILIELETEQWFVLGHEELNIL